VFESIYTSVLSSIPTVNTETELNEFFNPDFINFLLDYFMPYIFIWGSFALKGLDISRITNGTIEKYWATRKGFVTSAKLPADYLISVPDILIG